MEQLQLLIETHYKEQPLLIGLSGLQGVGKTTIGKQLKELFSKKNIIFDSISIDDFYLSYNERQQLDKQMYKYRGPPGTHYYNEIFNCLNQFKKGESISVPIFDKSLYNGQGDIVGKRIINTQILLFEGWFVGFQSKSLKNIDVQLETNYSFDIQQYFNEQLKKYEKIWDLFDILVQLKPNPYQLSLQWRLEAEQKMKKQTGYGMDDDIIQDFVYYFWNCLHPLIYNDFKCDLIIEVNKDRIYQAI